MTMIKENSTICFSFPRRLSRAFEAVIKDKHIKLGLKIANIFEEYANGGLQIINSWIEESEEELLENIEQNMTKLGLLSAKA